MTELDQRKSKSEAAQAQASSENEMKGDYARGMRTLPPRLEGPDYARGLRGNLD